MSDPRRLRALSFALCAFAYAYVFPYQVTLNNPNENVRFYMTAAMAESGRYAIDHVRARWGWVNDAAARGGHFYSVKAPGTSTLGVPGYFVYQKLCGLFGRPFERTVALWVCRITASVLPTLCFAWWYWGFLARRGYPAALISATFSAVLLGSLLYGYGMLFVSHTLSAVVAFVAFAWLYEVALGERAKTARGAFTAGLLAAATTWFEYPGLVASVVLSIYAVVVLRSARLMAFWVLGGALPALAMMHFQWRAFGNPFTPGHLFVESAAFRAAHHEGFYGAVGPSGAALYGLLIDLGAGLFPLTPYLWFALPGLVLLCRDRDRATRNAGICCSALCLFSTLVIASMNNWRGGWTVGPRYLALCVPFLGWAALHALSVSYRRSPGWSTGAAGLALGATAASCVGSGIACAYYPHMPPELTRPLPQLLWTLITHGYAPPNLGNWFGVWGSLSMLPLLLAAVALWLAAFVALPRERRAGVAVLAAVSAVFLVWPLCIRPRAEPGAAQAQAFVIRRFSPSGHDRAARLEARLRGAGPRADPIDWTQLSELYTTEGRDSEAATARRRADQAGRR